MLRPGMTATAEIVTTERRNVLLVPNAALRWSPERDAAAQRGQQGGVTSVLVPRGGRGGGGGGAAAAASARSRSAAAAARPSMCSAPTASRQPVRVVVGESNGSETEIIGGDLREGQEVITARLAAGQTQDKSERRGARRGPARRRRRARRPRAMPPRPQPPPAAGAAPPAAAAAPARAAPAAARRAEARPSGAGGGGGRAGRGGQRLRDMTPEQRRAFFESLTPEQRAADARAPAAAARAREAEGATPPDGE